LLLEFDTGEAIEVAGAGLVGRDPDGAGAPPGNGDTAFVHLIAVEDPARSVSKTHLEFWREGSGLAVRDRHSTNGSKIERADGSTADLPGGQAEIVRLGEAVLFGARRFNVRGG
jgi:hypothetical protein